MLFRHEWCGLTHQEHNQSSREPVRTRQQHKHMPLDRTASPAGHIILLSRSPLQCSVLTPSGVELLFTQQPTHPTHATDEDTRARREQTRNDRLLSSTQRSTTNASCFLKHNRDAHCAHCTHITSRGATINANNTPQAGKTSIQVTDIRSPPLPLSTSSHRPSTRLALPSFESTVE